MSKSLKYGLTTLCLIGFFAVFLLYNFGNYDLGAISTLKNLKYNDPMSELKETYLNGTVLNSNVRIRNFHYIKKFFSQNGTEMTITSNQSEFLVILVQVHNRIEYLKEVIDAMSRVKYIDDSLVIFSHDFENEKINSLIEGIDFCSTMQIFYPYSIQFYPNSFPGRDPNDCPEKIGKAKYTSFQLYIF